MCRANSGPGRPSATTPPPERERGVHVLGEPGVVERLAGLVVADHQPGVVAVGQSDVVHRAEFRTSAKSGKGSSRSEAPQLERRSTRARRRRRGPFRRSRGPISS